MGGPVMQGWILSSGSEARELARACEEARAAGVHLEVVAPKEIDLVLDGRNRAALYRQGVPCPLPMFVLAAFVEEADAYNLALLQQLETQGVLCVNRAGTLKRTGDKLLTLQLLAAAGLPVPRTVLIGRETTPAFVIDRLGLPVVIKVNDGSKGVGVTLVRSGDELGNLLEMLRAAGAGGGVLAQEFIAESCGRDLRVLVIDGEPRVGMLRRNRSPEGFKSNISAGGSAEPYPLTEEICALSRRVIGLLGLNIGGIDLLFQGDGFVVGEANSVPGFQGIEASCGINVPAEILRSIGRQLAERAAARARAEAEGIRSLDELQEKSEPELVRLFRGGCSSVARVQEAVLMDIVRRNERTEFGERFGFGAIRTVAEFRQRVPFCEWSDLEPYARRMELGETDLLFAGPAAHFICTSGTTGNAKLLPESRSGAAAKALVSRLRLSFLVGMAPEIMAGHFLPLANAAAMGTTAGGIPYGMASGLTLAATSPEIRRRVSFPPDLLRTDDPSTLDYLIMRYSVARPDVRLVVGNNPGRLTMLAETADRQRDTLIADIGAGTVAAGLALEPGLRRLLEEELSPDPERARALRRMVSERGRLEPRDYWPELRMVSCWLGGTIGRYIEGLQGWLPEGVLYADCGYGASEGKFNVPLKAGVPEGPLALPCYFFEFVPLAGGEPRLAHELQDGGEYLLAVTSYSGLYRYHLHDIVTVCGFTGENPNIRFTSKTADIANLAGEKLTGSFLSDLLRRSLAARTLGWRHFCIVPDPARHRYDCCIEPDGEGGPDGEWLAAFDAALQEESLTYRTVRSQRLLLPPRLVVMRPGWLDLLYADRLSPGVTASQVKLPVICGEIPHPELIGAVVER